MEQATARSSAPCGDKPLSVKLSDDVKPWGGSISGVFVLFLSSVVFSGSIFMVKSERDADTKEPTKVTNNTDIDAMIAPMASNILPSPVNIIVNGIYIID